MNVPLRILRTCDQCGGDLGQFIHRCGHGMCQKYGCPTCDNHCSLCYAEVPSTDNQKTLSVDDAISMLTNIKDEHGGDSPVMVCVDGMSMPYLQAWQVAVDDDDPLAGRGEVSRRPIR